MDTKSFAERSRFIWSLWNHFMIQTIYQGPGYMNTFRN